MSNPEEASRRAMALPIPLLPPTTSAVLSSAIRRLPLKNTEASHGNKKTLPESMSFRRSLKYYTMAPLCVKAFPLFAQIFSTGFRRSAVDNRRPDDQGSGPDFLHQPGHIFAQILHGLHAFGVVVHIARLTTDTKVPVGRARDDHAA